MKIINKSMLLLLAVFPVLWVDSPAEEVKPEAVRKLPESAKFFLSGDPKFGIDTPKEGEISMGIPSRIKVVPGLTDTKCVSLMTDRNVYLRHQMWKFKIQKRPDGGERTSFDMDSTFKVVYLPNGDVRFEAAYREGEFMAVDSAGKLILSKPAEGLRMDFRPEGK